MQKITRKGSRFIKDPVKEHSLIVSDRKQRDSDALNTISQFVCSCLLVGMCGYYLFLLFKSCKVICL